MGVSAREERAIFRSLGRTPVPRNYAREQYRHAVIAPERQQALQAMLRHHLPEFERVLIGVVGPRAAPFGAFSARLASEILYSERETVTGKPESPAQVSSSSSAFASTRSRVSKPSVNQP